MVWRTVVFFLALVLVSASITLLIGVDPGCLPCMLDNVVALLLVVGSMVFMYRRPMGRVRHTLSTRQLQEYKRRRQP
jgi:hypothetical protein